VSKALTLPFPCKGHITASEPESGHRVPDPARCQHQIVDPLADPEPIYEGFGNRF
jgi:hypothetical protein